jgi:K+-transporting ATPase KdpF subunit
LHPAGSDVVAFIQEGTHMETLIAGLIALVLFVYLFTAVIRPEKF